MVREALTPETLSALEPRDVAAYFIARRAEGLTSSEQQLLTDWLARDEAHRRMFDSAERAWQVFADSESDEILAAMREHARVPRRRGFAQWKPAAAAAAVLMVAVGAALLLVPTLNPWSGASATIRYATSLGEVKDVQLPDGGSMTLDADSSAVVRFTVDARTVELQRGRAFFAVTADPSRPFTVTAARRRVTAIGTRFDVNLPEGALTVTLLEGQVKVGSFSLKPGQQYVERLGKASVRTIGTASENAIAWRVGLIAFDDQPLAEAAAVMNRYSQDQIVIRDPGVASIRLSGQFRAGDTQRFADTLAEIHALRSVRQGREIELVRR